MTTTTKLAEIVSMLVEVARAAHYAMDNCGDLLLTEDGAEKLSSALDALDELPEIDDWYVRDGWCKAKDWLIALNAYTTPQPSADAVREYDRELIARMLLGPRVFSPESVAEQSRLLREAENLEADARTVVRGGPDGMVLVPREPDVSVVHAMREAYRSVRRGGIGGQTLDASFQREYAPELASYHALISAASGEKGVG